MATGLLILIAAAIAVGFFVIGLSLTLIIKGRNLQSEIGENENMNRLGIKCTSQQIREDDAVLRGKSNADPVDCNSICGVCGSVCPESK
ncbi:MAG: hypothetical protein LIO79_04495 [Rikenellaceae bacterium]|nr:hypothetical protein [Rikenellaceae bacterium]